MSLYATLKADRIAAMKSKDATTKARLTVFLGDLESDEKRGTEITDEFIIAKLKKTIQTARDNLHLTMDMKFKEEMDFFEGYLPKQMTPEEMETVIRGLVEMKADMGFVMKEMKTLYAGFYDGRMASTLAKKIIAEKG